jgi:dipeptidyl-peptidase-4
MKPKDFDASKKYPVFMYQYSGPGSQSTIGIQQMTTGL